MTATQVSVADKIRVLTREINYRQRLYPRWVAAGKISQLEAAYQIEVMTAILDDYKRKKTGETLL